MKKTIIIGYGNPDRQDDGASWHVLSALADFWGRKKLNWPDEYYDLSGDDPELMFNLQLMPEIAETIAQFDRVCFVDAHTGSVPNDLNIISLQGTYQNSPFTHHMTPETCLSIAETVYKSRPESILVSVRGYQFGFDHSLSPGTKLLVKQAVDHILVWIG